MPNKNKFRIRGTNIGYDVPIIILIVLVFIFYVNFIDAEKIKESIPEKVENEATNSKEMIQNQSNNSNVIKTPKEELEVKDGIYYYSDNMLNLSITIKGNIWIGKTMFLSGMGENYDNQNTKYESGILKGNSLYEKSGMVEVGYLSGNRLTTSIGGQTVVLRK